MGWKWQRLLRLRGMDARLTYLQVQINDLDGAIETLWEEVASAKAKAPDGMPGGSGFSDRYPAFMDKLETLKARKNDFTKQAYTLFGQMSRERERLAAWFGKSPEKELLTRYFINLSAYRQISRDMEIPDATVRRRIQKAVEELEMKGEK